MIFREKNIFQLVLISTIFYINLIIFQGNNFKNSLVQLFDSHMQKVKFSIYKRQVDNIL